VDIHLAPKRLQIKGLAATRRFQGRRFSNQHSGARAGQGIELDIHAGVHAVSFQSYHSGFQQAGDTPPVPIASS
jgi:hypothetical protein